ERAAGAAVRVEEDAEAGRRHGRDADLIERTLRMFLVHFGRHVELADAVPRGAGEVAGFEQAANDRTVCGGEHGPVRTEHLEAVPRRRVVAGRDLDRASSVEMPHGEAAGRGRGDTDILYGTS